MSDKTLNIFTSIVIGCIFILLAVNYLPSLATAAENRYLTLNGVQGVEIFHKNIPYTLNFDQQNILINEINKAEAIGLELIKAKRTAIPFDKIVVYQFNKPTITLTPINVVDQNIIFKAPEWNKNGYIQEQSGGELLNMLSKTFDS